MNTSTTTSKNMIQDTEKQVGVTIIIATLLLTFLFNPMTALLNTTQKILLKHQITEIQKDYYNYCKRTENCSQKLKDLQGKLDRMY